MLSRRLLLGLPSRLPENRCILVQSTSKAGGQVRPAGAGDRACPVVGHEVLKGPNTIFPNLSHVLPSFSGQNGEISL